MLSCLWDYQYSTPQAPGAEELRQLDGIQGLVCESLGFPRGIVLDRPVEEATGMWGFQG